MFNNKLKNAFSVLFYASFLHDVCYDDRYAASYYLCYLVYCTVFYYNIWMMTRYWYVHWPAKGTQASCPDLFRMAPTTPSGNEKK